MKNIFKNKNGDLRVGVIISSVIIGIVIYVLFIAFLFSLQTIESGEVGLKVKFGKIVDTNLSEGLNIINPFTEDIVKVNIKVQKSEMNIESSTKDLQIVQTNVAVNYRIDSEKAVSLYKEVGNEYEETVLNPAIKESIKSAIAKYNAEEITINRGTVSQDCLKTIQEKVSKYGIIIEDFNLTDFSFSQEYTNAIEQKQVAEQNLEKSKLEAEQKIIEAEATKKANDLLKQTLTDEVLLKQFIEKWNGQLPTTYAGEDILGMFKLN